MSRQVDCYTVYKDAQPVHLRFHSHGTDARAVLLRFSIHMERTHEPCVPTLLPLPFCRYEYKNKHGEAGEIYSYFRRGVVLL
ncbi:hypothetical protein HMPREF9944_01464 [Segatella maculosa OT 289]|uniref:Uncharacterized protein n=1 Tax=Segatella maculosa OT 289 TaxID=999422 RepID=H1HMS0_9BACT|nr:hypothetical protein HMPREF9944_01464 [Segatella maculosa OT 289]